MSSGMRSGTASSVTVSGRYNSIDCEATVETARELQIPAEVGRLIQARDSLAKNLSDLLDRIKPVLSNEHPKPVSGDKELVKSLNSRAGLADILLEQTLILNDLDQRIVETLSRIEI